MPVAPSNYDNDLLLVHVGQAERRLPGPDYYTVLKWIHEILRPATYIEIGVRQGDSLRAVNAGCRCLAVDPAPALTGPLPDDLQLFPIPSDELFLNFDVVALLQAPTFSLAFIDGLHLFEQALRDFIHLERLADRNSIIMIHDSLPLDAVTADRERSTHFYSGDIWKVPMCLKQYRPDLKLAMIKTAPTGLCLVGNLDSRSKILTREYERCVAEYVPMAFERYENHPERMPEVFENTREAVEACLMQLRPS